VGTCVDSLYLLHLPCLALSTRLLYISYLLYLTHLLCIPYLLYLLLSTPTQLIYSTPHTLLGSTYPSYPNQHISALDSKQRTHRTGHKARQGARNSK
jgi:hypothetical protein